MVEISGIRCLAFDPTGLEEADTGNVTRFAAHVLETGEDLTGAIVEVVEHGDKALTITTKRALTEDEESMLRLAAADMDYVGGVEFKEVARSG